MVPQNASKELCNVMFHSRSTMIFISLTNQRDGFGQHERSCPSQKFRKLCSPCLPPVPLLNHFLRVWEPSRQIPSPPRHLPRGMPCPLMRSRHNSSRDAAIEAGEYATHAHPSDILSTSPLLF